MATDYLLSRRYKVSALRGSMPSSSAVTQLLGDWRSGDADALDKLTPLVYEELRRLAHHYMRSERSDHTLQATGLVNEAFVHLAGMEVAWKDRVHFFAIAARLMRRILVDYAKARGSLKRGKGIVADTLRDEVTPDPTAANVDIIELDDALNRLAEIDARKCDVVVLHYFGGLNYDEVAQSLEISAATVHRELRFAKAWLANECKND